MKESCQNEWYQENKGTEAIYRQTNLKLDWIKLLYNP